MARDAMLTVITGAAGFIGGALSLRFKELGLQRNIRLIDRAVPTSHDEFEWLQADLTDRAQLAQALRGADRVIHLAALPGGAAEADPEASRRINLDGSLNLFEALGRENPNARLVFASSIAILGAPDRAEVDDETPARPVMTYGAHKLMIEYALLDATRRGLVDGLALRLPGVVARPPGPSGLKSAFMSDIFRAIASSRSTYDIPVDPEASMWLLSGVACANALIHAANVAIPPDAPRAFTLPALNVTMAGLVEAIAAASAGDTSHLRYRPDPLVTRVFGRQPRLVTHAADSLGFVHDESLPQLVDVVLRTMKR